MPSAATISASPYAAFAFEILYCKLNKIKSPHNLASFKKAFGYTESSTLNEKYPLFVTWNTLLDDSGNGSSQEKELRGCIGCFSPLAIELGIKQYSLVAALEDPRFDPIEKEELHSLSCSITLLKDFEQAQDIYDWTVGKHGVRISFSDHNKTRNATFLPDVAVEQGWDKDTTLKYLVAKAGASHKGPLEDLNISLTRYKGEKSQITYNEFIKIRNQLE